MAVSAVYGNSASEQRLPSLSSHSTAHEGSCSTINNCATSGSSALRASAAATLPETAHCRARHMPSPRRKSSMEVPPRRIPEPYTQQPSGS